MYDMGLRGYAASNAEGFTTFQQTLKLPSSGEMLENL
jgi:hypothetical protein